MNTTTRAAEQGWLAYRSAPLPPTREEINAQLATDGLPAVSPRMYKHYRTLARHGQERYMPINELDMAIKADRRHGQN